MQPQGVQPPEGENVQPGPGETAARALVEAPGGPTTDTWAVSLISSPSLFLLLISQF